MLRNYDNDRGLLQQFLKEFSKESGNEKVFPYVETLKTVAKREESAIFVHLDHVNEFNDELCAAIENNTLRYQKLISAAIDDLLVEYRDADAVICKDALDVYLAQRIQTASNLVAQNPPAGNSQAPRPLTIDDKQVRAMFPPDLLRRYEVYFIGRQDVKPMAVREVLAASIGHLVQVRGVVIRSTEVKPLLQVATYTCDQCGMETYQEVPNPTFMPLSVCMNEMCKAERNAAGGRLHPQTRGSKFMKFQELRVQELPEQVPVGNVPRCMTVYCRGINTSLVQPGDNVHLTGVYLPSLKTGFRQMAQGLVADTYLDAHRVKLIRQGADWDEGDGEAIELTEREIECLKDPEYFNVMARSLAPEIYGHEDIKKALLLLLIGGVELAPKDMRIRGSINMCLMGDPGVAKSQLLGFVYRLAPRSQYTTGRGSSGVGLTAAVMKDPLTSEMTLEAGALVLADRGVCCIDEFDKMAEFDRTAIHEVMEQQTISIAKAGILTTLNARVSILAAANPAFGRYNPRKTVEQNVDLPAALLSRFDLLWLIQDRPDREQDLRLAQHITYVHTHNRAPTPAAGPDSEVLSMAQLRRLILACRNMTSPFVPKALSDYLVGAYVELRKEARNNQEMTYTSARTLLAILRISTALARLHLRNEVTKYDIDEAMRLMEASRSSVHFQEEVGKRQQTFKDHIFQVIREMLQTAETDGSASLRVADVMERCAVKGYRPEQVNQVIDAYERISVWSLNRGRTVLTKVN